MFALNRSRKMRDAKKDRSNSNTCMHASTFFGIVGRTSRPLWIVKLLAGRTAPPAAITLSLSKTDWATFFNASVSKIESASMLTKKDTALH